MKKRSIIVTLILVLGLAFPMLSFAQGMMNFPSSSYDNVTIQNQQQEELEGKKLLDDLNNKAVICSQLTDSDFEKIGEYYMGQSIGDTSRHIAMNEMMKRMMGDQGEGQMHVANGKRFSGCDASATYPTQNAGFLPVMNMMWGGWSSTSRPDQSNNSMMNFGFMSFGWIFMILWWVLIIAGIVAIIKWLMAQSRSAHDHEKSPLEILKERYAKGEIDKKEFEDKKKDLN
ncbi:MAG: SHOCT domain-containing protein [Candidatus Paceibacterota bacterium]|jgi:putative membrane protein